MKPTRVNGTPDVSIASHAGLACLARPAQPIVVDAVTLRLQRALAQMDELKQALAASQQESIAAQKQVAILSKANVRLNELTGKRGEVVYLAPQCSTWELTDSWFAGLEPHVTAHVERLLRKRIRLRNGDVLYRVGDGFKAIYAIRAGSCKIVLLAKGGQEQVAGYHMAGEIIGIDGIGSDFHECQAIALEDMEVCRLPFDEVENLARLSEQFGHNLHKLLSKENARVHVLMLVLGTMRAISG